MSLQVDLVKPEGGIDGDEDVTDSEVLPQWRAWHMKKAKKGIEIKEYYEPKRVKIADVASIGRSLPPGFMNAVNELLQHDDKLDMCRQSDSVSYSIFSDGLMLPRCFMPQLISLPFFVCSLLTCMCYHSIVCMCLVTCICLV